MSGTFLNMVIFRCFQFAKQQIDVLEDFQQLLSQNEWHSWNGSSMWENKVSDIGWRSCHLDSEFCQGRCHLHWAGIQTQGHQAALSRSKMKLSREYLLWLCQAPFRYDKLACLFLLWLTNSAERWNFFFFNTCSSKGQNNFKQGQAQSCNKNAAIPLCNNG